MRKIVEGMARDYVNKQLCEDKSLCANNSVMTIARKMEEAFGIGWITCEKYANGQMVSFQNSLSKTYTKTIEQLQKENSELKDRVERLSIELDSLI